MICLLHLNHALNKSFEVTFKISSNQLISRKFSFQSAKSPSSALLYDTEELSNTVERAKERGQLTTHSLRKLVMNYTKKYDHLNPGNSQNEPIFNRIKQINGDLDKDNNPLNDYLNAFIMEFFSDCGDLESALDAKNRISSNFSLDSYKIFKLATLLVKNDGTDAAINLIESQLIRLKFLRNNREQHFKYLINRSINQLLNALIDRQTETQIIRKVFEMCVTISPTNVNKTVLSPLIKMHLVKGDLSSALKQYVDSFINYGIIPWNIELMRVFIEAKDEKSLQTVLHMASQVYGPYTIGLDLSAAYLYCELEDEAKREISKIKMINQKAVVNVCRKFIKDERFDCLKTFILITKTIGGIDGHKLFSLISDMYKRRGQMSKAIEVMDLMRQQNIKPKEDML